MEKDRGRISRISPDFTCTALEKAVQKAGKEKGERQ